MNVTQQHCWVQRYISEGMKIAPGFERFLYSESNATAVATFTREVVPGLLQTRDYTHDVLMHYHSANVELSVSLRLERQAHIKARAALTHFVVTEDALRRQFGAKDVWRAQLTALRACPNLYVLAGSAGRQASDNYTSFSLHYLNTEGREVETWIELDKDMGLLMVEESVRYDRIFNALMGNAHHGDDAVHFIDQILEETSD